jgi:hypothetical protein
MSGGGSLCSPSPACRELLEAAAQMWTNSRLQDPYCLEHRVAVVRRGWHRLQHIPVLDHLAVSVEAEDVDARGFVASPVQVTHVHKGEVAIDGDAFDLAGYSPDLLDITHDDIEPVREKRVVLNVGPAHETWIEVRLTLVENLVVDCVEHASDVISGHARSLRFFAAFITTPAGETVNAHKAQ